MQNPVPRAYMAEEAKFLPHGQETLLEIISNEFETLRQVVLQDSSQADGTTIRLGPDPARRATLLLRKPNRVEVETSSTKPSFLVLTDSYYPGWKATVDGQPARIYQANQIFRAVRLPAGKHRVVFRFVPLPVYFGVAVTILAAAITGGLAFRERRRAPQPVGTAGSIGVLEA